MGAAAWGEGMRMRVATHFLCIALALVPIISAGDEVDHEIHSLDVGSDVVGTEVQHGAEAAELPKLGEAKGKKKSSGEIGKTYLYSRCWFVIRTRDSKEKRAKVKQALALGRWKEPPKKLSPPKPKPNE